nr:hypothetical protein Q903MT_gene1182 [Picea sitchensis]
MHSTYMKRKRTRPFRTLRLAYMNNSQNAVITYVISTHITRVVLTSRVVLGLYRYNFSKTTPKSMHEHCTSPYLPGRALSGRASLIRSSAYLYASKRDTSTY